MSTKTDEAVRKLTEQSIAQKRKTGNFAYIPPEEGYEIIRDYYGISISKREPRKHDRANVLDLF